MDRIGGHCHAEHRRGIAQIGAVGLVRRAGGGDRPRRGTEARANAHEARGAGAPPEGACMRACKAVRGTLPRQPREFSRP
eukprot:4074840-Pleurochrysis_carterae.AAC.2